MRNFLTVTATIIASLLSSSANNLTLRYDRPAQFFEEALVIGNGTLGATIYGATGCERISLNDITLWTGEPEKSVTTPGAYKAIPAVREALRQGDFRAADSLNRQIQGHYSENYQPLGTLLITYSNIDTTKVENYVRSLSLNEAVASSSFSIGKQTRTATAFASAPDSALVISIGGDMPVNATICLTSLLPHKAVAENNTITAQGYAAYHSLPGYASGDTGNMLYDPERGTRFCTIVRVIPDQGEVEANPDGTLRLSNCHNVKILLTSATSFNGFDRDPAKEGRDCKVLALNRMKNIAGKATSTLLETHKDDYRRLFSRMSIDLGTTPDSIAALPTDVQLKRYTDLKEYNPDLEELYFQYGRYLLISCSRTPGVPANLQGLWNEMLTPPWSSNYTCNINVEENYWPAEVTGLGELHETAMIQWIRNLTKSGAATAAEYYGAKRGWCLGHNSDIWAMTNPVGMHIDNPQWACWNMGGAWVSTHIWEHFLFSRDLEFLRRNYPTLKGAAEFCLDWMIEKNGELITSPSTSPENVFITPDGYHGATHEGGTSDLAMIRQCLSDARDAANELNIDHTLQKEITDALSRIRPYQIGHNGNLVEWMHDWQDEDPQHRHQSHLFGLFPGRHISPESTPELAAACNRSLEIKGDNTTGWSTGWRVNLYARLLNSDKAYGMFRRLLQYVSPDKYKGPDKRKGGGTYPNLLDAHSPFQIDGNFGGTAGVAEMLIQSTPDTITLLPALPWQWQTGCVTGLRARGGFIIDMSWSNRQITSVTIHAPLGGNTTLRYNGKSVDVNLQPQQSISL